MVSQLTFDLALPPPTYAREDFVVASGNREALAWIDRWPDWPAPALALASAGSGPSSRLGFGRASLVGSAILLVGACLAGLYNVEQERRIQDLADVDSAGLNDDLPIAAYADHGFNAFIKQNP